MSSSGYIFDITPDRFNQMVIENSSRGPVLVYFWSEKAAPCMKLLPRLVKLADDFNGQFLLTLLNTDRFRSFARERDVMSIPTVQIYVKEAVVNTIHGAFSEAHFRKEIEKWLPGAGMPEVVSTHPGARSRFRQALRKAKRAVGNGEIMTAWSILENLPAEAMDEPEIELLYTHLHLIRTAQFAPGVQELEQYILENPGDFQARFQRASLHLVNDEYDAAIRLFMALKSDRNNGTNTAVRSLIAIFSILGESHPLTRKYSPQVLNKPD